MVSVIIPVFNRLEMLDRALASVLSQTYKNFEILLIDDHSTQDLSSIFRKYNLSHIKTTGKGVSAARNTGVNAANGEWIAFLDSDDEWLPQKLETQMRYLEENPNISFVHSNEVWLREQKPVRQMEKHKKYGGRIFEKCLDLCNISVSCTIIKKSLFQKIGMFDDTFPTCEDYDLWLRVSAQENIGFIETPLTIKHGGHKDQLSHQHHSMDLWRVRALMKHLRSSSLSPKERSALIDHIRIKSSIVLSGALKYSHQELTLEIQSYLSQIQ